MYTNENLPSIAEIFKQGNILTVAKAKGLISKTIACTSPEFEGNEPSLNVFTVKEFITSWEQALSLPFEGFANRQQYWLSFMTVEKIETEKNRLVLVGEPVIGLNYYVCDLKSFAFDEPTFHGSDADREVYFITLNEI